MFESLVNGEISALVPVSDRGLAYGDGVFETLAVFNGRPRWWQDHMDRLAVACERLALKCPPQTILLNEVQTVSLGQARCVVKIILTRGSGLRGYSPGAQEPTRIVTAHPWPDSAPYTGRGVRTRICELRLGLQPVLGGMKHLNRLEQVMAAAELAGSDAEEGILLDHEEFLISAISSNIFLVSEQQLLTPRLDRCGVRGVVRGRIVKEFKSRCELRRVSLDMLPETDEVFLSNTIRGIVPVLSIDAHEFVPGPVTRELQEWMTEAGSRP